MDMQTTIAGHPFLVIATIAGLIAIFGIVRDQRQIRRADLDKVSLVSWGVVSSIALIAAIVCLAMGLRAGL